MAIFGNIEILERQIDNQKFAVALAYLNKTMIEGSVENIRLKDYALDVFEKVALDEHNFALEQVYMSKEREKCFFESHKQYIDVQFILEGEEIIEVMNADDLVVSMTYDTNMDLMKYNDAKEATKVTLKKGDIAIFYPEDAHMPCLHLDKKVRVTKTVVKVAV